LCVLDIFPLVKELVKNGKNGKNRKTGITGKGGHFGQYGPSGQRTEEMIPVRCTLPARVPNRPYFRKTRRPFSVSSTCFVLPRVLRAR
jgi:hypothetical protein